MPKLGCGGVPVREATGGGRLLDLLLLNDRSDFEVAEVCLQQAASLRGGNRCERRDFRLASGCAVFRGLTPQENARGGARRTADDASDRGDSGQEQANETPVRPGGRTQALGEHGDVLG